MDMAARLTGDRQHIVSKMNLDRFRGFMGTIATAIHGAEGSGNRDAQNAFFQSEKGTKYLENLTGAFNNIISSLSPKRETA
jgi:hypothetical protein